MRAAALAVNTVPDSAAGVFVPECDTLRLTARRYRCLLRRFALAPDCPSAAGCPDVPGVPAVFRLCVQTGDTGARCLRGQSRVHVAVDLGEDALGIDTPDDLTISPRSSHLRDRQCKSSAGTMVYAVRPWEERGLKHYYRCAPIAAALAASAMPFEHAVGEVDHTETPHHLSALLGVTDNTEDSAATLAIDYEYRVSEFLGLGAVAEQACGDIDAKTVLVVADLHFGERFAIQTGPGLEWTDKEESTEREFVYRVGVLYEMVFGEFTISPQLHGDFTAGDDSLVAGVAFGFAF